MSKLIAFDQALNTTGYSIFEDGSLVSYDKFTTSDTSTAEKLKEIRGFIIELFKTHKPSKVAFEEIQLQQIPGTTAHGNVETFKKLAYVQAILLETLVEFNIPYEIVSSNTWKSTCNIRGRARAEQKRNAQKYVETEFGVKAIQDICDSICIGKHVIEMDSKEINWE